MIYRMILKIHYRKVIELGWRMESAQIQYPTAQFIKLPKLIRWHCIRYYIRTCENGALIHSMMLFLLNYQ